MERRCERALRPGCTALSSGRAPTSRSRGTVLPVGLAADGDGARHTQSAVRGQATSTQVPLLACDFPLTKPPGGGPVGRSAGIGFHDYFQTFQMDYENRVRGRVVDG